MSGPVDVLADLQGVVRIAKAASLGVTGNKPRIERAEQAIAAVAELIETLKCARDELSNLNSAYGAESVDQVIGRCDAALARARGAK